MLTSPSEGSENQLLLLVHLADIGKCASMIKTQPKNGSLTQT